MHYTNLATAMLNGSNAAAVELEGLVRRDARRVAGRFGYLRPQQAGDFVDDAPGHVAVALMRHLAAFLERVDAGGNPGDDPAFGYVQRVLENHYLTFGRKAKRAAKQLVGPSADDGGDVLDTFPAEQDRDVPQRLVDRELCEGPFADDDLARIAGWSSVDAVILLAAARLHRKLPAGQWASLLADCDIDAADVPADLHDDPQVRPTLAGLLGVGRAAIDQRWKRGRQKLHALRFVREALEGAIERRVA